MTKDDDLEVFVRQLEVALRTARIDQDKWKQSLLSQLTLGAKETVMNLLEDDDSSCEDIRAALLGSSAMTFSAAAESFFTADKGNIQQLPTRQVGDKLVRYCEKMTEGAETVRQVVDKVTVGMLRALMVPDLKKYMDFTKSRVPMTC